MMTLSGVLLTLDNDAAPSVLDIAVGLSRVNRFGGQTFWPWSDAQHSLVCQQIARDARLGVRMQLIMLLHDAHEMVTGDACRPFKPVEMSALQAQLDGRIYRSLGVRMPTMDELALQARIDDDALLAEAYVVTPRATYRQACLDISYGANPEHVDVVREVLALGTPPAKAYEELLSVLLREVKRNDN